jgi:hypothetical protein
MTVPAGTRVNVLDLYGDPLPKGKLVSSCVPGDGDARIALDDGRIISGRDCFWLPAIEKERCHKVIKVCFGAR